MKYIRIRTSKANIWAIVDDDDYPRVSVKKWWLHPRGYAYTQKSHKTMLLHRFIMNTPSGKELDHINLNKLDCRKSNLRECTRSQNNANKVAVSGIKGVRWSKNAWQAEIKKDRKYIYIGRFKTSAEAAEAYDKKAKELFGDFARLNGGAR